MTSSRSGLKGSDMNPRERVVKAVEFDGPDRVPNGCYPLALVPGPRAEGVRKLFKRYPSDFAEVHGMARTLEWGPSWQKGIYVDDWGVVWKNLQDGVIGQPITHPLSDWKNLETYELPDPFKGFEKINEAVSTATHERYMLAGEGACGGIWHRLHALRGFDRILTDIVKGRKELLALIDRLVEINIEYLNRLVELNIDGVMFGDDWGTQTRLMIKPEQWRKYFKPAYEAMFNVVRRSGKHIFFHSDGYMVDIIPDLIEIGVNVANVQVTLMGVEELRHRFGGEVCIAADVDRQHTMPFGTVREVRRLVRSIVRRFRGFSGGLILYGEIGPDVPIENAESMLKALQDYGNEV